MKTKSTIRSATAIVVSLAALAATAQLAPAVSARPLAMRITHPQNNAIVDSRMVVTVRTPARSHCHLRIFVDGKLVDSKACGSKRIHKAQVPVSSLSVGRHKLRVTVQRGKRRTSRQVQIRVVKTGSTDLVGVPSANAGSFDPIFTDNFDKPAALGTWASDSSSTKVVYIGSTGTKWVTYPKTYVDTVNKRPYRSDGVLSVHDGYLDFWLHNVGGQPAGAAPGPLLDGNSQYQTYGRYSVRAKVDDTDLPEYYMAWLLWPQNDSAWATSESDFPEGTLAKSFVGVDGFTHVGNAPSVRHHSDVFSLHDWHTYTQDWTPVARRYYVDGTLIGVSSGATYGGPERWQLQTETRGNGTHSGHILVDWVSVYSYSPQ